MSRDVDHHTNTVQAAADYEYTHAVDRADDDRPSVSDLAEDAYWDRLAEKRQRKQP
jgi:hypothetical protein